MTEYVLVTGASRNIGRAIATRCKADGYSVIMLDRIEPEDATLGEFVRADLADPEATATALARITEGRTITRAVLNAAVLEMSLISDVKADAFDMLMAVNTRANIQLVQALVPGMKAEKFGRIITLGSRSILGSVVRETSIAASKGAMLSMTRSWAVELAPHGITVNMVGPGAIETDMLTQAYPLGSETRAAALRGQPSGRFGKSEEVAHAISFFLDSRSGYVSGQDLFVCGAMTAGRWT